MKTYCYQCGTANQYAIEKPNFCMKCGCALSATQATKAQIESLAVETELEMSNEKINSLPSIDELQVEIDASAGFQIKLGEIAGTSEGKALDDDFKTPELPERSKKQFLDDFKKEAGETRPRPKK